MSDREAPHTVHSMDSSFSYRKTLPPGSARFLIAQSSAGARTPGSFDTLSLSSRSQLGALTHFHPTVWLSFDRQIAHMHPHQYNQYVQRKAPFSHLSTCAQIDDSLWSSHLHWHQQLYQNCLQLLDPHFKHPLIVLGGDHGCSSATLRAFSHHVHQYRTTSPYLLWMDAHFDLHSLATTESGFWHGMPLGNLLNVQPHPLCSKSFDPAHVFHLGARSFEPAELHHVHQLQLPHVFLGAQPLDDTHACQRMIQALEPFFTHIAQSSSSDCSLAPYALTLDLDFLDPQDFFGTGCLAPGPFAPTRDQLLHVLRYFFIDRRTPMPAQLELMEYLPARDPQALGIDFMSQCIDTIYWHYA